MAKNYYSYVVTKKPVRLSYLHVFDPDQNGKYSACLLIPKENTADVKAIKDACNDARVNSKVFDEIPASLRSPLHDGDGEKPNGGTYGPECKGMWVLNAKSNQKPAIVDKRVNPILDPDELYSGCWANVDLAFTTFNVTGNKGINVYLNAIQKIKDGEKLGSSRSASSVFAVEDGEDDDLI